MVFWHHSALALCVNREPSMLASADADADAAAAAAPTPTEVVIFGSRGFIGRNVCRGFRGRDEFRVVSHGGRDACDLTDADAVQRALPPTDARRVVIHCAAMGGRRPVLGVAAEDEDQKLIYLTNVNMMRNIMDAAEQSPHTLVIHFSSGAAFDRFKPEGVREACTMDLPASPGPADGYGAAKWRIEKTYNGHPQVTNVRLFGCYGEDEEPQRFRASCKRASAIEGGKVVIEEDRKFDFVHVKEVARLCAWLAQPIGAPHVSVINAVPEEKRFLSEWARVFGARAHVLRKSARHYTGRYEGHKGLAQLL